jgi:hypothetical protein
MSVEARGFLFPKMFSAAVERTQPPVERVQGVHTLEVKRLWHEVDLSPLFSHEVKNNWRLTSSTPIRLHTSKREFTAFIILLPGC